MDSIAWNTVLVWFVLIGAPVLGGVLWLVAFGGPEGERRNKLWTQGPFVPANDDEPGPQISQDTPKTR